MFGIGLFELIVIVVAAIVFIGPKRLPEVFQKLGRLFVQLRRMSADVRATIDDAIKTAEHELAVEDQAKVEQMLREKQALAEAKALENQAQNTESHQPASAPADAAGHEIKDSPPWDAPEKK